MRTIHKQHFVIKERNVIYLPKGSRILTVQMQRDIPTIWYECDPDAETEIRYLIVVPTGGDAPGAAKYIGTIQEAGGALIWHVYEDWP